MSRTAVKPAAQDSLVGRRVAISGGPYAGKVGKVAIAYRGRPAGLDRAYVEIDDNPPGWSVAVEIQHLKVMG